MNTMYHIAIIEGYLAQHLQLPRNVQDAIAFLKQVAEPKSIESVQPKKKKKYRMTPETRAKLLAALAKAREVTRQKREAKKAAQ